MHEDRRVGDPNPRTEIETAVAGRYFPSLKQMVRTYHSVPAAKHRGMVTTIVNALTKQFAEAKPEPKRRMHLVPWKPKAENWEKAKSDPYHLEFCMMNEYDNPQMKALQFSVGDVAEADGVLESEYKAMLEAIKCEYEQFHSLTPATKGSENWPKTRSARLLYGEVKIDGAYRKRAERHLRNIVKFERVLPEIAAYVEHKADKKARA